MRTTTRSSACRNPSEGWQQHTPVRAVFHAVAQQQPAAEQILDHCPSDCVEKLPLPVRQRSLQRRRTVGADHLASEEVEPVNGSEPASGRQVKAVGVGHDLQAVPEHGKAWHAWDVFQVRNRMGYESSGQGATHAA